MAQFLLGNWAMKLDTDAFTGQPQTIDCTQTTGAGTGCYALYTGADPYGGKHNVSQFTTRAAFANPPVVTQVDKAISRRWAAVIRRFPGRNEATRFFAFQFISNRRTPEVLNPRGGVSTLTNTPAFAQPGNTNFLVRPISERSILLATRPNDPRELQFALKFYF